ncbi:MAG: TIGR02301 family protein [Cohaesibacteraceae bacterium]|nr:TIGR02301 family protein [Cohaesibacteraceae bacterium]
MKLFQLIAVISTISLSYGTLAVAGTYEQQRFRLADILGTLSVLDFLCHGDRAEDWQSKIKTLLESDDPSDDERQQIVGRYNRNKRSALRIHTHCTPAALIAIERLSTEGSQLAREMSLLTGR